MASAGVLPVAFCLVRLPFVERRLDIEYERRYFDSACSAEPDLSVVLRDLDVTPPGSSSYVFDAC